MALYRIHRIKDTPRETFRWAAHASGSALVKPKDYDAGAEVEAATPYAAWRVLQSAGHPLRAGDLLELVSAEGSAGALHIAKYTGFDPAQWFVPEPKTELNLSSTGPALSTHTSPDSQGA